MSKQKQKSRLALVGLVIAGIIFWTIFIAVMWAPLNRFFLTALSV